MFSGKINETARRTLDDNVLDDAVAESTRAFVLSTIIKSGNAVLV